MDVVYELTIFEADDETPLATLTTDPTGSHPHLKAPQHMAEQVLDLQNGTSSIGQINVEVVDVPTDPDDQQSGYFTSLLATAGGESALNGHRAVLNVDAGDGMVEVLNGVVWRNELVRLTTYRVQLRDIREREREVELFTRTDTPTIVPRGVLNGYGVPYPDAPESEWLVPPAEPVRARYRDHTLTFLDEPSRLVVTDEQAEALLSRSPGLLGYLSHFDRLNIRWTPAAGGSETVIERPVYSTLGVAFSNFAPSVRFAQASIRLPNGERQEVRVLEALTFHELNEALLPGDGDLVDVIIQYNGPVTEYWHLHIEGITEGEFLANCYDGVYSDVDPRVPYDEAAVSALDRPVRAKIRERVDDMREWLERHFYRPRGGAPAVIGGKVTPVLYAIPPVDEALPTLDDANCKPLPGWGTGVESAVNHVEVQYHRDIAVDLESDPLRGAGDGTLAREITVIRQVPSSIALLGKCPLEISTELYRALGGIEGQALTGNVTDEIGHQLAHERATQAIDRFLTGGQAISAEALRTDPDVEELTIGDWVLTSASWWPDYQTGRRGGLRLAQVVSRKDMSPTMTRLGLEDSGPSLTPVAAPTVGALTVTGAGEVEVPVTAIPSGAEARIDYAVSESEPAADSPLWIFVDRTGETGDVHTPPVRDGGEVWIRHRGEAPGRRPSSWTTVGSIVVGVVPRVGRLGVLFAADGRPTVTGHPGSATEGVRIYWAVHPADEEAPSLEDDDDFDADGGEWELPAGAAVAAGQAITVDVEGWTGFSTGAVAGDPGMIVRLTARRRILRANELETPTGDIILPGQIINAPTADIESEGGARGSTEELRYFGTLGNGGTGPLEYQRAITTGFLARASWSTWASLPGAGVPESITRNAIGPTIVQLQVRDADGRLSDIVSVSVAAALPGNDDNGNGISIIDRDGVARGTGDVDDDAREGRGASDDLDDMETGGFIDRTTGEVTDTTGVGERTAAHIVAVVGADGRAKQIDLTDIAAGDLDNVSDGATHKRTTENEKTGAGRGFAALDSSNRLTTEVLSTALISDRQADHVADRTGLSGQHWILKTGEDLMLRSSDFDGDPLNGARIDWNDADYFNAGATVSVPSGSATGLDFGVTRWLYYDAATSLGVLTASRDSIAGFDKQYLGKITTPSSHGGGGTSGGGGENTIPGT